MLFLVSLSLSPSPWRIVDDAGAAFSMGAIGGSIFSYWKGYKNSPPVSKGSNTEAIQSGSTCTSYTLFRVLGMCGGHSG